MALNYLCTDIGIFIIIIINFYLSVARNVCERFFSKLVRRLIVKDTLLYNL